MSLERINERLDEINEKIHNNHMETLKAINTIEKSVTRHDQNFSLLKVLVPTGSFFGLISFFRDLFK